jgi:aminobenzoyl-glutamate transport protein
MIYILMKNEFLLKNNTLSKRWKNRLGWLIFILSLMQLVVILLSWLLTAADPDSSIRSLLSSEGIRWFIGKNVENLCQPLLVWLLMVGTAWGTMKSSGFNHFLASGQFLHLKQAEFREQTAFKFALFEFCLVFIIMILLTAFPHAVLLNITGHLYPGPFFSGIVPVASLTFIGMGMTYGCISGKFLNFADIFDSVTLGVSMVSPLIIIYIVAIQLYYSILFVF